MPWSELVCRADFRVLTESFLEGGARMALVLTVAECWWDTIHTFHIADREMTMTLLDTYRLTRLHCSRPL